MNKKAPLDDSIRLLYVDDEPALLEIGKLFLERDKGIKVTTTEDPVKAVSMIAQEMYDVVISDYEMPGINGIELLKILRTRNDDTPFIIFTGKGREDVVIEALNNGADFYLQKGGDPKSQFVELVHMVRCSHNMRRSSWAMKIMATKDAALEGMCLLDEKRRIVYANHSMAETYQLPSPDHLVGLPWRLLFDEGECARLKEEFFRQISEEQGFIGLSKGVRKDGNSFPIEIVASLTGDGDLIVAIRDLSEIQQAQEDLRMRDDLLHSLVQITNAFINADLDSVDVIVDRSLGSIGGLLGVDRVYVFNYDMDNGVTSNTHEWCAEGIEPQIDELQDVPLEAVPEWVEAHLDGEPIVIADVGSLPEGNIKDILLPQGVKSLLTMPMFYDKKCMGFVGFDSVREHRDYSKIELDILNMFGDMLVNLRMRMESQELIESVSSKHEALLKAFPDMILTIGDDGVITQPPHGINNKVSRRRPDGRRLRP